MKRPKFKPAKPTAPTTRRHPPQDLAALVGRLRSATVPRPTATTPLDDEALPEPIASDDDCQGADEDEWEDEWEDEEEIGPPLQESVAKRWPDEGDDLQQAEDDDLPPSDEGPEQGEGENGSESGVDAPVEALATREPEVESQGRGPLTPREKLRWDVPLLAAEVAVLLEVPEKTVRNAAKDRRLVRCGTLAQSSVFTWKAVLGWLGATDDE